MVQFYSKGVCESKTLNTSETEVFIIQNTNVPVITDQDVDHNSSVNLVDHTTLPI